MSSRRITRKQANQDEQLRLEVEAFNPFPPKRNRDDNSTSPVRPQSIPSTPNKKTTTPFSKAQSLPDLEISDIPDTFDECVSLNTNRNLDYSLSSSEEDNLKLSDTVLLKIDGTSKSSVVDKTTIEFNSMCYKP